MYRDKAQQRKDTMEQIDYKKYRIDHVYDCSEGYDELDHYTVWTPDGLNMVAEEFINVEQAKLWIDSQIKKDTNEKKN